MCRLSFNETDDDEDNISDLDEAVTRPSAPAATLTAGSTASSEDAYFSLSSSSSRDRRSGASFNLQLGLEGNIISDEEAKKAGLQDRTITEDQEALSNASMDSSAVMDEDSELDLTNDQSEHSISTDYDTENLVQESESKILTPSKPREKTIEVQCSGSFASRSMKADVSVTKEDVSEAQELTEDSIDESKSNDEEIQKPVYK